MHGNLWIFGFNAVGELKELIMDMVLRMSWN
jgi:hypothetical protein